MTEDKRLEFELWSIRERRIYPMHNAIYKIIDGVTIYATPKGEPLVLRKR